MTTRRLLDFIEEDYSNDHVDDDLWEETRKIKVESSPKRKILLGIGVSAAVVVLVVLLAVFLSSTADALDPPDPDSPRPPSSAPLGNFSKAAITTNGYLCAPIGRKIFEEGGNVVDAAIATLLCEGVMNIQSMGVGGGFFMNIYLREKNTSIILNARETAPAAADKDMFHGNSTLSQRGGLSVAISGELRGYEEAFKIYGSGKITWERLFLPTIDLCRDGFAITSYLAGILKSAEANILANPGLREFLVNETTGSVLKEGDLLKRPALADTFTIIAKEGANAIYNGSLTDSIVQEIREAGGIITKKDFQDYQVQWLQPVTASIGGHIMYSVPPPGSGAVLAFILNILDGFVPGPSEVITWHRIIEAFKFGYGRRTELGDYSDPTYVPDVPHIEDLLKNLTSPEYAKQIRAYISDTETHNDPEYYGAVMAQPEDHGTAHVSILAPNGDAVSVTSTINLILGSQLVSKSTGILWNDEMDDFGAPNITNGFGLPPSPANFIFPGKRPVSSMCPSIFVNGTGDVKLVTGAAGGSKITTSTALTAVWSLLFDKTIKEAIDEPRMHHQLFPMSIDYEYGTAANIVEGLKEIGHSMTRSNTAGSSVTGIKREKMITATYDFRRGGSVDGF